MIGVSTASGLSDFTDLYANYYSQQQNQLIANIFATAPVAPPAVPRDMLTNLLTGRSTSRLTGTANTLLAYSGKLSTLATSANVLANGNVNGLFQSPQVTVSDVSVMSATAQPGAAFTDYTVNTTQLASAQTVQSNNLAASATSIAAGSYTFSFQEGTGPVQTVNVKVNAGDTNGTVLNNILTAMYSIPPWVNASIVADGRGNDRLQLSGIDSGASNVLKLADVSGTLVAQLGLNNLAATATATTGGTSQVAQDAKGTLNGVNFSNPTNTLQLDSFTAATLLGLGTAKVDVDVKPDPVAIGSAINTFVSNFNDAVNFAQALQFPAEFTRSLGDAVSTFQQQLAGIGITTNPDGTLSVDQVALNSAIATNVQGVGQLFTAGDGVAVSFGLAAAGSGATVNQQNSVTASVLPVLGPQFLARNPLSGFIADGRQPFGYGLTYDQLGGVLAPNFASLFNYTF